MTGSSSKLHLLNREERLEWASPLYNLPILQIINSGGGGSTNNYNSTYQLLRIKSVISGALGAFSLTSDMLFLSFFLVEYKNSKSRIRLTFGSWDISGKKCLPAGISIMLTNLCWYLALRDCYGRRTKQIYIKPACSSVGGQEQEQEEQEEDVTKNLSIFQCSD